MPDQQRNLVLAIIISIVILLGFQYLFPAPSPPPEPAPKAGIEPSATATAPGAPGQPAPDRPLDRAQTLAASARLAIEASGGGRLRGSIALTGARIDDLVLTDYRETVDPGSPNIVLLSPVGTKAAYYVETGWVAAKDLPVALPGPDTVWQVESDALSPASPALLRWDNGQGLVFERRIALDGDFMFTLTDRVINNRDESVTLYPYGLINRTGHPELLGYYILHEGPLGVFGGTLVEVDYDELEESGSIPRTSTGGWIGITDKYWQTALVPAQSEAFDANFRHIPVEGSDKYQVDVRLAERSVAAGASAESTLRVFAGAKEVTLLDRYQDTLGIARFDRSVDFGWFYFLTKPLFYVLHHFNGWLGNLGLAILLLTVIIKLLFFPLANKSYVAMSRLKNLQPEMLKLRERFPDDRERMNREMMELYRREKANPLAGCLPIVVQIPVFFALYKVLFVTIEMRHAPFYGWIHDLSGRDPTSLFNLFGLVPWTPPEMLAIGVWPLAMGVTMFIQQKLSPAPPDPIQARMMMALPIVFTFLFATFPAGLVLYWTWNNVLSILQQWLIMRRVRK